MPKKDYKEYVQYILEIDKDEIKELESGNFSIVNNLNYWMTYHKFDYIFAILKGSNINYNLEILNFISILSKSLSFNPELRFEAIDIKSFIKYYSNYLNIDISDDKLNKMSSEDLIKLVEQMIKNICEVIQVNIEKIKQNNEEINQNMKYIKELNIENIDNMFNDYQFKDILKILKMYSDFIDYDILNFISVKTQSFFIESPIYKLTKEKLIYRIESANILSNPWLKEMSYEELVIEFNNYISKNSIIILKKIIEICSNNIKKYGLILEKISENTKNNKKLSIYLSDYLFNKYLMEFNIYWNNISKNEQKRINYISNALKYGAITNSIHNTCKTADMIESLLFENSISSCDIPKIIREINDKRILASIINRYINDGILQINEKIEACLPSFFNFANKRY